MHERKNCIVVFGGSFNPPLNSHFLIAQEVLNQYEEKLGVTYKQIAEYIETGKTEKNALEIIKKKEQLSMHKKMSIPVYKRNDI